MYEGTFQSGLSGYVHLEPMVNRQGAQIHQAYSNTVKYFESLEHKIQWLSTFWADGGKKMREFNSQSLSNTIYALGQLQIRPGGEWLSTFWVESGKKMREFTFRV
jgi:hypothetical protein